MQSKTQQEQQKNNKIEEFRWFNKIDEFRWF